MKKSLLVLSAALFAGLAASAASPTLVDGAFAFGVSPNGEWGISSNGMELALVNMKTGEQTILEVNGLVTPGSCIANNGTIVLSSDADVPYIVINGEAKEFDVSGVLDCNSAYPNGISADAKYVVGTFSPVESSSSMTGFPVLWEIDNEGKVVKAIELPYPTVDFVGLDPQRCNAIAISEDCKTIVGNLVDWRGMMPEPIVYTKGDDGEWSYTLPAHKLLNPNNVEFPELGPEPKYPNPEDYMTDEEKAEYAAAKEDWWQDMSQDYPQPEDFMTEEEIAEFNADASVYNAWNDELLALIHVYDEVMEDAVVFETNSELLSPDGKTIVASASSIIEDPYNVEAHYYVVSIDLATGETSMSPDDINVCPNQIIDGGVILGTDRPSSDGVPQVAYIKDGPDAEYVTLYEYYQVKNPALAEWMEETWHKEFEVFNWMTWEAETYEGIYTGLTFMSKDGSVQFSGVITYPWDEENDYVSYIVLDTTAGLGKVTVGNADLTVSAARGGIINIAGDADRVTVYDLAGRVVFSAPAAASVATGLANGAYIVKVDSANGSKTAKVAF